VDEVVVLDRVVLNLSLRIKGLESEKRRSLQRKIHRLGDCWSHFHSVLCRYSETKRLKKL